MPVGSGRPPNRAVAAVSVSLSARLRCSRWRAFAAPILGDATRYLCGYRLQPPVVAFEDDDTWGQPGGVRYPVTVPTALLPGGRLLTDTVLERVEGKRWRWQIDAFTAPTLFFVDRAVGKWVVGPPEGGVVPVQYGYTYHPTRPAYTPLLRLFVAVQVRGMLRQALREIQAFAESDAEMLYP